ncbi:hypothetical protein ATZ33_17395 [Enterococcus silesiacus]|uniref:Uncharacterized protein n=1 Tax=Enterococcus silesiacus TaxID=332949 RepID=A0A0S3KFM5_9ENTE|nr:hypothetical protein [Enterococcus silesiacus]ALS03087.1 hypothetical protein ATZ33_17395 [Enterococcus silesiacus]OJG93033.1 hypothetical protein RV15_GL002167 [Enterococcus silesiacus]
MQKITEMNGYILFEDKEGFDIMVKYPNKDFYPFMHILDPSFHTKNNEKYDIQINTVSNGPQNIEGLKHTIEQYEKAIEAAEYFKTVLKDNKNMEFI